jgi:GDP-4-dehydro-6-deoxy-D-mannose reductase
LNKFLITGFSGFVSKHFIDYLNDHHEGAIVIGLDINDPVFSFKQYENINCSFKKINLIETEAVKNILLEFQPNYILHLASFSSVAYSWEQPVNAFVNNLNIFLNLVDQIRLLSIDCRILSVGSSEEYGKILQSNLPLVEDMPVNPISPYAVARHSQEQLSKVYCEGYGLNIVMTRSFNHIGPGQLEKFAIPSFIKKILEAKKKNEKSITVGNVNIVRDFVDVRDVVKAYYLLLLNGKKGEIYNICSNQGVTLKSIIENIMDLVAYHIKIEIDPALVRPNDNEIIIGSYDKIKNQLDWEPTIQISKTLNDIIEDWKIIQKSNTI